MGVLKSFLDGYRFTEEEEELLEKLRKKEKLGYSIVRQVNELMRQGQYPPIIPFRFARGVRSVVSDLLQSKTKSSEK